MENMEIMEKLSRRFPICEVKSRSAGFGQQLEYISQDQVISRLNEVLGAKWSVHYDANIETISIEITKKGGGNKTRVQEPHPHAIIKAQLTIQVDNNIITKEGYGAENLEKSGMDVDTAIKSAQSSALKKAAVQLGIGLYLYDEEERNYIKRERENLKSGLSEEDRKKLGELFNLDLDKITEAVLQYSLAKGKKLTNYKDLHSKNIKEFINWVEDLKK
jgi:hypothetical protein